MKNLYLLLFTILPAVLYSQSREVGWLHTYGNNLIQTEPRLHVTNGDDLVVFATFAGTIDLGIATYTAQGDYDAVLVKYDRDGSPVWSVHFTSAGNFVGARSVRSDDSGNIYLLGDFEVDLDVQGETLTSNGRNDVFIARVNTSGEIEWMTNFGGMDSDYGIGMQVISDRVYLTLISSLEDPISFGELEIIPTGNGTNHLHLVEMTLGGIPTAASTLYSGGIIIQLGDMETDSEGNLYHISSTIGNADIQGENTRFSNARPVLIKTSSSGEIIWSAIINVTNTTSVTSYALEITPSDQILCAGQFSESIVFGGQTFSSEGPRDGYIASYNTLGEPQWLFAAGGSGTDQIEEMVYSRQENAIYSIGQFESSLSLGEEAFTSLGNTDLFISKLSPDGTLINAFTFGGNDTEQIGDKGWGIDLFADNSLVTAGRFNGNLQTPGRTDPGYEGTGAFIINWQESIPTSVEREFWNIIHPNPVRSRLTVERSDFHRQAKVLITTLDGRALYQDDMPEAASELTIDIDLPPGLYLLHIRSGEGQRAVSKFQVIH